MSDADPLLVACLGASAGGLQALTALIEAVPSDCGVAFVVVHHVDPDHESLMAELLAAHTSMPVTEAHEGQRVLADHVYVIPPDRLLAIDNGDLRLSALPERGRLRLPIDHFLHSLAREFKHAAAAVILSGTGSDGTNGISAIREYGGIVLAQEPGQAAHDGMPRSAIASGAVDQVLPVAEIPAVLVEVARHPYVARYASEGTPDDTHEDAMTESDAAKTPATVVGMSHVIERIIAHLRTRSPIDFSNYKRGTLRRRIERRMVLRHLQDIHDYLALLEDSPEETERLGDDLLISVTAFFRDSDMFNYLGGEPLRDRLSTRDPQRPLRIWVPACASGEEAYSVAIVILETLAALELSTPLQLFASDVDERALAFARAGIYPEAIELDVSAGRLARFFVKEEGSYRVRTELRESIVFAQQNVLADFPFSRLDLVSCRNLLIYLVPAAQTRLLDVFHYALGDGGLLFLGSAETADAAEMLFRPRSKRYRVYERSAAAHVHRLDLANQPAPFSVDTRHQSRRSPETLQHNRLASLGQRLLIERYAPASALIDANGATLYVDGPTDRYLQVPRGESSRDLQSMAREGLRASVGSAIRIARQTQRDAARTASLTRGTESIEVEINVHPVIIDEAELLLVTFADIPPVTGATLTDTPPTAEPGVATDERELESIRLELQTTVRDFERSSEELRAANEEAMSMNEEFQSTNEELEASKEELQSLNEELSTLNIELRRKAEQERRLSDDLNNLLASSGIATLFLDRELHVMRFTPPVRELFNLIATDIGRPIGDITARMDDTSFPADASGVLATLEPAVRDVSTPDGRWFSRRLLAYRGHDGMVNGVVATYADISELKTLQQSTLAARNYAENIVDTVRSPLLVLDAELTVVSASRSYLQTFATTADVTVGRSLFALQGGLWEISALRRLLERVLPDRRTVEEFEITVDDTEGQRRVLMLNARQMVSERTAEAFILLALEDVTQRSFLKDLRDGEAQLRAILDAAQEAIIVTDEVDTIVSFSAGASSLFGYQPAEMVGRNVDILLPNPVHAPHDAYMARLLEMHKEPVTQVGRELDVARKDGSTAPARLTVSELRIGGRQHFMGILHDLSDERRQQTAMRSAQKLEAIGQLTGGVAHDFNNLLNVIIGNLELLELQLDDSQQRELLDEAADAARVGASLTSRLLAFARRQPLEPCDVSLNVLSESLLPLLRRTLPDKIVLRTEFAPDLAWTRADPGQIESVLLNLALNARDAMPAGGTLAIETRNVDVSAVSAANHADAHTGRHVRLSVSDSGSGMTAENIERAVEPFFTTKGPGGGSGLGLSMVYGFARQSGGHTTIDSKPGRGTTVSLYLPVTDSPDDG